MSKHLEGLIDANWPLMGLLMFIGLFLVVLVSVMFVHKKSDYAEVASLPLEDNGEVQQ